MKIKIDKNRINPKKVIVIWLIALFVFTIVKGIIIIQTVSGGVPEDFFVKMLNVAVYSVLVISAMSFIITPRDRGLTLGIIVFIALLLGLTYL